MSQELEPSALEVWECERCAEEIRVEAELESRYTAEQIFCETHGEKCCDHMKFSKLTEEEVIEVSDIIHLIKCRIEHLKEWKAEKAKKAAEETSDHHAKVVASKSYDSLIEELENLKDRIKRSTPEDD